MPRGKKIVLLSAYDFTGSGYRICEAVSLHTNNFMQHIVMLPVSKMNNFRLTPSLMKINPDDGKDDKVIRPFFFADDLNRVNRIIAEADIIHLKSDYLITEAMFKYLEIPENTPIIHTVCGSGFRIGIGNESRGKGNFEDYVSSTDFRTALNPDLNYPAYDAVYTPFSL